MGGACSAMGEGRHAYRVLVGNPKGNKPLGRPRRKWEDNIKVDLQDVGCGDEDLLSWLKPTTCNQPTATTARNPHQKLLV
jgi:hypothetical protein